MNLRSITFFTLIILTIGFVACTKDNTTTTNNNTSTGPAPVTPSQQKLLDLVNAARTSGHHCGGTFYPSAPIVVWNTQLEEAAQKHSDYMNNSGNFSHTGENGSDAGQRVTATGYNWMTYGENIAEGFGSEEAVIQAWLESAGHCENIMNPDFKEMGIATSGNYWTQVFGAKQ